MYIYKPDRTKRILTITLIQYINVKQVSFA